MNIRQISDGVTYFGGAFFSFYAVAGERPALIELGISQLAPGVARAFREIVGLEPATLVAPHSHYDHTGGTVRLMEIFPGAELAASAETASALADEQKIDNYTRAMQLVNTSPLFREVFPNADNIVKWAPPRVGRILSHGDTLDVGGGTIDVIATPGHSPCSVSLFHRESGALFVSDACGMPLPSGRIWPTAFDDVEQYLASLRRMLDLSPSFVCPGHFMFFRGNRATRFLEKSIKATESYFENVQSLADSCGGDEKAILEQLKKKYGEDIVFIQDNVLRYGNKAMTRQVLNEWLG